MPKTKISEYSTTNSDNTDIESINIAEGCAPSGINNAIRELMVHLKEFQTGSSGDPLTVAGGFVASGGMSANTLTLTGILTASGGTIMSGTNTMSGGNILSGTNTISGAAIISGNINSSGTTNTFSGGNIFSGTNTISGSAIISGNINSSGTNTFSGSNVMSFGGGTSASPSIYFASDTNTGIFSPAADTIAFAEGGAEAMRINSSGNVQVNGTTGSYKLNVFAPNGHIGLYDDDISGLVHLLSSSSNTSLYIGADNDNVAASSNILFAVDGTERMRIASDGNVGIGVAPNAWSTLLGFDMSGGASLGSAFNSSYLCANSYFNGSAWKYRDTAASMQYEMGANGHIWYTAPSGTAGNSITFTERARIDSSGNFMVGTTSTYSSSKMTVESTANIGITSKQGTAGGYCFLAYALNNGGTYYHASFQEAGTQRGSITSNGSATAYNTTSDYRLKENIAPITNALSKVVALKPCTYTWKNNGFSGEGFIAHELAEVCPQAVTGEKDAVETYTDENGNEQIRPKYQGVDTSFLVATLTAAIQELKAITDAQTTRIEALEAEVAVLKGQ